MITAWKNALKITRIYAYEVLCFCHF